MSLLAPVLQANLKEELDKIKNMLENCCYLQIDETSQDILHVISHYSSLRATRGKRLVKDNTNHVYIFGTLSITDSTYKISIEVILPKNYPTDVPLCYMKSTALRMNSLWKNPNIDSDGKIQLYYLQKWKKGQSNLLALIQCMSYFFGEKQPEVEGVASVTKTAVETRKSKPDTGQKLSYSPSGNPKSVPRVLEYIKQSPEHQAKLEQILKPFGDVIIRRDTVLVQQIFPDSKKNNCSWTLNVNNLLKDFLSQYSTQSQILKYFEIKHLTTGPAIVKVIKKSQSDIEVSVTGLAKDVAHKIYELKEHDKIMMKNNPSMTAEFDELNCPDWIHKYMEKPISVGRQKWPKVEDIQMQDDKLIVFGDKGHVKKFCLFINKEIENILAAPRSGNVDVPKDLHGNIIGKDGINIKELRSKYKVTVMMPERESKETKILVKGKREDVVACIKDIRKLVEKQLNSFIVVNISMKQIHIVAVLGYRGKFAETIIENFNVEVMHLVNPPNIRLRGKHTDVKAAQAHIEEIVKKLTNFVILEVSISVSKHRELNRISQGLLNTFKGVREIVVLNKSARESNVYLTGEKIAIDQLFQRLKSDYAAKSIGYTSDLIPEWNDGIRGSRMTKKTKTKQQSKVHNKKKSSSNASTFINPLSGPSSMISTKSDDSNNKSIPIVPQTFHSDQQLAKKYSFTYPCPAEIVSFLQNSFTHTSKLMNSVNDVGIPTIHTESIIIDSLVAHKPSEISETEWQDLCQVRLQSFFKNYKFCQIPIHPSMLNKWEDTSENDIIISCSFDKCLANFWGLKSEVDKRVGKLEEVQTRKKIAVFEYFLENIQILKFFKQSPDHFEELVYSLSDLGTVEILSDSLVLTKEIFQIEENDWTVSCECRLKTFFKNYSMKEIQMESMLSESDINFVNEINVREVLMEDKIVIYGLKTEVERRANELEILKKTKKSVFHQYSDVDGHVLEFIRASTRHFSNLQQGISDFGVLTISDNNINICGMILPNKEKEWKDGCNKKLRTFFAKYITHTIKFHPLCSIERIDVVELNVKMTWSQDETSVIVCGLKEDVRSKVIVLEKIKDKKKNVSYTWLCSEQYYLDFVKNSSSQLKKLKKLFADLGFLVVFTKSITVHGEILVTLSTQEWERRCKSAFDTFFAKYSIKKIKVSLLAVSEAQKMTENRHDVVIKWQHVGNFLIVYGLSNAVTGRSRLLNEKLVEIEKEKKMKPVIYIWTCPDQYLLDFLEGSTSQLQKLKNLLSELGSPVISVGIITIHGQISVNSLPQKWKENCKSTLDSYFTKYSVETIYVSYTMAQEARKMHESRHDVVTKWLDAESSLVVYGLSNAVTVKTRSIREKINRVENKKVVSYTWNCPERRLLNFIQNSGIYKRTLKKLLATQGSVVIRTHCIIIHGLISKMSQYEEWKKKCKSTIVDFFTKFSIEWIQVPPEVLEMMRSGCYIKNNDIGKNVVTEWSRDKTSFVVYGLTQAVIQKMAILKADIDEMQFLANMQIKVPVHFSVEFQDCHFPDFLQESPTHFRALQNFMSDSGDVSISDSKISVDGEITLTPLYTVDDWSEECDTKISQFFNSNYGELRIRVYQPAVSEARKMNENLTDVVTEWIEDAMILVVYGIRGVVEKKAESLKEKLKIAVLEKEQRKCVSYEWISSDDYILNFLQNSAAHVQKLRRMLDVDELFVLNDRITVTGKILKVCPSYIWELHCEEVIDGFLDQYAVETIQVQPSVVKEASSMNENEENVVTKWLDDKKTLVICGLEDDVKVKSKLLREKIDEIWKKKQNKDVSYVWDCPEVCLLEFIEENLTHLQELEKLLSDLGTIAVSDKKITVCGQILGISSSKDWETNCKTVIENFFSNFQVERIAVPLFLYENTFEFDENQQNVITKWLGTEDLFIVYGLNHAVKCKTAELSAKIKKLQKLNDEYQVVNSSGEFTASTSTQQSVLIYEYFLVMPENKAKSLQAYKDAKTRELLNVKVVRVPAGVMFEGKRLAILEALDFAISIVVDEVIFDKHGLNNFLSENTLALKNFEIEMNCQLLVKKFHKQPGRNQQDFKCIQEDEKNKRQDIVEYNLSTSSPYGDIKLLVEKGNIKNDVTDMMVEATTKNRSDSLFSFQALSSRTKAGFPSWLHYLEDDIAITSAGASSCSIIMHVIIPDVHESMDELITKVLEYTDQLGMSRITLPTIGVGSGGWNCADIALGIHVGIMNFAKSNPFPKSVKQIKIMVDPSTPKYDEYQFRKLVHHDCDTLSAQASSTKKPGLFSRIFNYFSPSKSSTSLVPIQAQLTVPLFIQDTSVDIGPTNELPIELTKVIISSKVSACVEKAKEELRKFVNLNFEEFVINDPSISKLKQGHIDNIREISADNDVNIIVDCRREKHSIKIQGHAVNARKAFREVGCIISSSY